MNSRRLILEQLAQAMATGLEQTLGSGVDIGLHGRFDDEEITRRKLPLRALVVAFNGSLSDCIIGITSMREDVARSAVAAAAIAISKQVDENAVLSAPQAFEFDDREEALEQLEALYQEPTVNFTTPKGDLLIVMGSGLVHSVENIQRGAARDKAGGATGEIAYNDDGSPMFDDASAGITAVTQFVTSTPDSPFSLDGETAQGGATDPGEFATLAAEAAGTYEGIADPANAAFGGDFSAAAGQGAGARPGSFHPSMHAVGMAATAAENAIASTPDADRWATLLTGVEVEVTAELGRTHMQLGDVASLHEECVLTLDQLVEEPVTVYVNGTLYARARLVVVDDEYGIEILEVLDAAERQPIAA